MICEFCLSDTTGTRRVRCDCCRRLFCKDCEGEVPNDYGNAQKVCPECLGFYEQGKDTGAGRAESILDDGNFDDDRMETENRFLNDCHEAEENYQQFSSFSFLAYEINKYEYDHRHAMLEHGPAWALYEQGLQDAYFNAWDALKTEN